MTSEVDWNTCHCVDLFRIPFALQMYFSMFSISLELSEFSMIFWFQPENKLWFQLSQWFIILLSQRFDSDHFAMVHLFLEWDKAPEYKVWKYGSTDFRNQRSHENSQSENQIKEDVQNFSVKWRWIIVNNECKNSACNREKSEDKQIMREKLKIWKWFWEEAQSYSLCILWCFQQFGIEYPVNNLVYCCDNISDLFYKWQSKWYNRLCWATEE